MINSHDILAAYTIVEGTSEMERLVVTRRISGPHIPLELRRRWCDEICAMKPRRRACCRREVDGCASRTMGTAALSMKSS